MPFDSNFNSLQNTDYEISTLNISSPNIAPEHYTKLLHPELMVQYRKSDQHYIRPDLSEKPISYNMDEMRALDGMPTTVMKGEGIGKLFRDAKKAVKETAHRVDRQTRPTQRAVKTASNKVAKDSNKLAVEAAKAVDKKATKAVIKKVLNELNEEEVNNAIVIGIGKAFKKAGRKIAQSAKKREE